MNYSVPIVESILGAIVWFDLFDYPLTREEIWRFLVKPPKGITREVVFSLVDSLVKEKIIESMGGYYFLVSRLELVRRRQEAQRLTEIRMRSAKSAVKKIGWLPFVKAIFVVNKVGAQCPTEESDIDLLIVASPRRLWLVRFFSLIILDLFRLRETEKTSANKICPSFFLSSDALNLSPVALSENDPYLWFWLANLVSIYDPEGFMDRLVQENLWARGYIPNGIRPFVLHSRLSAGKTGFVLNKLKSFFQTAWAGALGDAIEIQTRMIQRGRVEKFYGSAISANNTNVVLNDKMLKFHRNDRREYYRAEWMKRCENYSRLSIKKPEENKKIMYAYST